MNRAPTRYSALGVCVRRGTRGAEIRDECRQELINEFGVRDGIGDVRTGVEGAVLCQLIDRMVVIAVRVDLVGLLIGGEIVGR